MLSKRMKRPPRKGGSYHRTMARLSGSRGSDQRPSGCLGDLQLGTFRVGRRAFWHSCDPSGRPLKEGKTMSKATYPLKLPVSVKKAAERLAKEDGVSLNQWISAAVAEKVGVIETAADFFKKRAGKAKGDGLMKFLRNAPRVAPEPEDQLR